MFKGASAKRMKFAKVLAATLMILTTGCSSKPSNDAVKDAVLRYYSRKDLATGRLTTPTILQVAVISADDPYEIGSTGEVRMDGSAVYDHNQHSKVAVFVSGYCHRLDEGSDLLMHEADTERWDKTMSFLLLKTDDGWEVEEVNGQDAKSVTIDKYVCD